MVSLTPKEIVGELDKYIIGQQDAKRAVAIALRNRYRRSRLPEDLKDEVMPKNILMIGPTGVGKTEIARRLAKLVNAPFIKIEATKFTEVGYVGRDVESMVRDLLETSIRMVRQEKMAQVEERARKMAEEKIVELLAPMPSQDKLYVTRWKCCLVAHANRSSPKRNNMTRWPAELDLKGKPYRKNYPGGSLKKKRLKLRLKTISHLLWRFLPDLVLKKWVLI